MRDAELQRFMQKVVRLESGCFEWRSDISDEGYGRFWFRGGTVFAHRLSYEHFVGAITEGYVIDHLCRNRRCVNPAHLEPTTQRTNILRGEGPTAIRARQTHCIHDHPLSGANLYVRPNGNRVCRQCRNDRQNLRRRMARGVLS